MEYWVFPEPITPPLHYSITPRFHPRHLRQHFEDDGEVFFRQPHAAGGGEKLIGN